MQRSWSVRAVALMGAALVVATSHAQTKALDPKLPDAVAKTFAAKFPEAEVEALDIGEENGVTVYDLEFKDGAVERETDIAADGTMLETTLVITGAAVPEAAMRVIREHAKGAKIGRIEHIEIRYKTEAGKVILLPELETHYAAELAQGNQRAEVVVTPAGTVIAPPTWANAKETKDEPEKK